jgi:tetratricopeptide (TPR) repeat protein
VVHFYSATTKIYQRLTGTLLLRRSQCRFALLQRNFGEASFRMHRLAQEVIRDGLDDPKNRFEEAVKILDFVFPDPNDLGNWPLCAKLLPSITTLFKEVEKNSLEMPEGGDLFDAVGTYLQHTGVYAEAKFYFESALEIRKTCHGEEHTTVAVSLNNLALLYDYQGRYEDAEPPYKDALKMREKLLGGEHNEIAMSLNNLAELYRKQGR